MARPIDCLIGAGLTDSPYEELLKENKRLKERIEILEELAFEYAQELENIGEWLE